MRQTTSMVDERCALCKYSGHLRSGERSRVTLVCDYILVTGQSRGCPAGAECDKFDPGDNTKRRVNIAFAKHRAEEPKGGLSHD